MQAVVLAAGESSRFWPLSEGKHKSLISLMGKPLIQWTLESLEHASVSEVVIIQSPSRLVEERLSKITTNLRLHFVVQREPKGMGDALLCAKNHLKDSFVLLHAHQFMADLWLESLIKKQQKTGATLVLAGQSTKEPWKYGMLEVQGDRVTKIIEKPTEEQSPSDLRALGMYLLDKSILAVLERIETKPYAFEAALNTLMQSHNCRVVLGDGPSISLKYPWDLFEAVKILMNRHLKPYRSGSAMISPLAHLEGDLFIGENARIFEYAVIKGPCYIGQDSVIGTHSIIRDHCNLEAGVLIGAHAEAARSIFQTGASTHSGYFGDSIFDAKAKLGAGTITANVKVHRDEIRPVVKGEKVPTGKTSLGVVVGSGTQLGISVKTMPGILIGSRSFVGPGVVVDESVPSDTRILLKQELNIKGKGAKNRPL